MTQVNNMHIDNWYDKNNNTVDRQILTHFSSMEHNIITLYICYFQHNTFLLQV